MPNQRDTDALDLTADQAQVTMKNMTADDRLLLGLYAYESLTVNEMSLVLQQDEETIAAALNSALEKLLAGTPTQQSQNNTVALANNIASK